ncbi:uncharacterized protein LOC134572934 [Pelobates fuscus]|uniref:uncharacterized protein LOC134572934 n=1 Tax=Pelobates fuscus TaxID=191477 RepID=UPI002FE4EECC
MHDVVLKDTSNLPKLHAEQPLSTGKKACKKRISDPTCSASSVARKSSGLKEKLGKQTNSYFSDFGGKLMMDLSSKEDGFKENENYPHIIKKEMESKTRLSSSVEVGTFSVPFVTEEGNTLSKLREISKSAQAYFTDNATSSSVLESSEGMSSNNLKYFSTPMASRGQRKKKLTPVMEVELESSEHLSPERTYRMDKLHNNIKFDTVISDSPVQPPLYRSFFATECQEIVNQLEGTETDRKSPGKRKLDELDVSTIDAEPPPYDSTPMKSMLACEVANMISSLESSPNRCGESMFGESLLDLEKVDMQLHHFTLKEDLKYGHSGNIWEDCTADGMFDLDDEDVKVCNKKRQKLEHVGEDNYQTLHFPSPKINPVEFNQICEAPVYKKGKESEENIKMVTFPSNFLADKVHSETRSMTLKLESPQKIFPEKNTCTSSKAVMLLQTSCETKLMCVGPAAANTTKVMESPKSTIDTTKDLSSMQEEVTAAFSTTDADPKPSDIFHNTTDITELTGAANLTHIIECVPSPSAGLMKDNVLQHVDSAIYTQLKSANLTHDMAEMHCAITTANTTLMVDCVTNTSAIVTQDIASVDNEVTAEDRCQTVKAALRVSPNVTQEIETLSCEIAAATSTHVIESMLGDSINTTHEIIPVHSAFAANTTQLNEEVPKSYCNSTQDIIRSPAEQSIANATLDILLMQNEVTTASPYLVNAAIQIMPVLSEHSLANTTQVIEDAAKLSASSMQNVVCGHEANSAASTTQDIALVHEEMSAASTTQVIALVHEEMSAASTTQDIALVHEEMSVASTTQDIALVHEEMSVASTTQDIALVHEEMSVASTTQDIALVHEEMSVASTTQDIALVHEEMSVASTTQDIVLEHEGNSAAVTTPGIALVQKSNAAASTTRGNALVHSENSTPSTTQNTALLVNKDSTAQNTELVCEGKAAAITTHGVALLDEKNSACTALDVLAAPERNYSSEATKDIVAEGVQSLLPLKEVSPIAQEITSITENAIVYPVQTTEFIVDSTVPTNDGYLTGTTDHTLKVPPDQSLGICNAQMPVENQLQTNTLTECMGEICTGQAAVADEKLIEADETCSKTRAVSCSANIISIASEKELMSEPITCDIQEAENAHDESVFSVGSLSFVTSTPVPGLTNFHFKNPCKDSVPHEPNLSFCSVADEPTDKAHVPQKIPTQQDSLGIQSTAENTHVKKDVPRGTLLFRGTQRNLSQKEESSKLQQPMSGIPSARRSLALNTGPLTQKLTKETVVLQNLPKAQAIHARGGLRPPLNRNSLLRPSIGNHKQDIGLSTSNILQNKASGSRLKTTTATPKMKYNTTNSLLNVPSSARPPSRIGSGQLPVGGQSNSTSIPQSTSGTMSSTVQTPAPTAPRASGILRPGLSSLRPPIPLQSLKSPSKMKSNLPGLPVKKFQRELPKFASAGARNNSLTSKVESGLAPRTAPKKMFVASLKPCNEPVISEVTGAQSTNIKQAEKSVTESSDKLHASNALQEKTNTMSAACSVMASSVPGDASLPISEDCSHFQACPCCSIKYQRLLQELKELKSYVEKVPHPEAAPLPKSYTEGSEENRPS